MTVLEFGKKIYDEPTLQQMMVQFSELAQFQLKNDEDTMTLEVTSLDEDFTSEEMAKECQNYVVSLTIHAYVENAF